ncbi:MAG TPA: hypothetical protein ENH88_04745 [Pseudoalteromonas prydzensis]|uniref:Uncharacterized protein n=1 Tax=Pseudoalteromonas prydzensis TaxID=182141 RepID=A0A7V1CWT1_9GAMM|nr:hypothetical protein [Pseudoalteromonas prydzensis]HEA15753.1 hypothetical protein [Pseudoalteromonas prydzensis]
MYKTEFIEAVKRSSRLGLTVPDVGSCDSSSFLQKTNPIELATVIKKEMGLLTEKEIVGQCLSLHYRLKQVFTDFFDCPIFYTIGYVEFKNSTMFKQTEESLVEMLKTGVEGEVSLHAWLTLPSMEVLDFSLPTSYAKVNNIPEGIGSAIAEQANKLSSNGMTYKPLIVGEDFLFKSKIVRLF